MRKLFLYILTGATILTASCNKEASSDTRSPDREPSGSSIRVMTYNIHHCNPPSRPGFIDVDAIVKTIRAQDPDLVALQEVDVNTERSGSVNQAEEIAEKLGMYYFFGKAIDYEGGEYGVAILSRYPMSEEAIHRLPTKTGTNGEPRILATAKITLPDSTHIRFGSTHLDAQKNPVNRQMQIAEIADIASAEELPFIIAGDFNAEPGTEIIGVLDKHLKRTCQRCKPTIPVINPAKAIDFIAYKHPANKFSVASHKVIDEKYASDHLPVVAVIDMSK